VHEPHGTERPGDALRPEAPRNPLDPEDEGEVLLHRTGGQEPVVLKDHPHLPAVEGDPVAPQAAEVGAVHVDRPLGGQKPPQDEREQARLPRARGPHQEDELAPADLQVDVVEGQRPGPGVGERDPVQVNHALSVLVLMSPSLQWRA